MEASHSCQMCGTCVGHVRDPIWAINTQTQDLSPGIVLLILDLMFPTMWEYNTLKVAINIFVLISGVPSSLSLTLPYNIQNAKKNTQILCHENLSELMRKSFRPTCLSRLDCECEAPGQFHENPVEECWSDILICDCVSTLTTSNRYESGASCWKYQN